MKTSFQELAKRIYRILYFDESDDSGSDDEAVESEDDEPVPEIKSLPSGWEEVTDSNIPPVKEDDIRNFFIYRKHPTTGKTKNNSA